MAKRGANPHDAQADSMAILFSEVRSDEFGREYRDVLCELLPPECGVPLYFDRFLVEDLERPGPGKWMRSTPPGERYPNYCYVAQLPYPCGQEAADRFLRRIEQHVDNFLSRVQQQIAA
jgi:hypothetical protein